MSGDSHPPSWHWLLAAPLTTALLVACTGGQTGSEGAGRPACESSSDPGLAARYTFTKQQVLEIAQGTWSGRYPGGEDHADPFDVAVTVGEPPSDTDAGEPNEDVLYHQPIRDTDAAVDQRWLDFCVRMAVRAQVRADASDPLFDMEFAWLGVSGDSLRSEPFNGEASLTGVVTVGDDVHPSPSEELGYSFVFGSDGKLWISIRSESAPGPQPQPGFILIGQRD